MLFIFKLLQNISCVFREYDSNSDIFAWIDGDKPTWNNWGYGYGELKPEEIKYCVALTRYFPEKKVSIST